MDMKKPVAWMQVHHKDNKPTKFSLVQTWEDDIPLYTHPHSEESVKVKELTLTDEDILEEWTCKYSDCYQDTLIDFARAILRKASEK